MKATIKLVANLEEIRRAEELALPKPPKPIYVNGTIHFREGNVYHFYTETIDKERTIVIYLYPGVTFRLKYNRRLHNRLVDIINGL